MNFKPLILITNDDGVEARGIRVLEQHLRPLGEVWVVAPAEEQSAVGHGITLTRPLRIEQHGERRFGVTGTPADAVIVALNEVLPRAPALVLSGINHGLNVGTDVFYSGTVAGAMEGAIRGLRGIAVSQDIGSEGEALEAELERTGRLAAAVTRWALDNPIPERTVLNLNAPSNLTERFRVTTMGRRTYEETVETRQDLRGVNYYWIGGPPLEGTSAPGTDSYTLEHGEISVTHLGLDLTYGGGDALERGALDLDGGFTELAGFSDGEERGAGR